MKKILAEIIWAMIFWAGGFGYLAYKTVKLAQTRSGWEAGLMYFLAFIVGDIAVVGFLVVAWHFKRWLKIYRRRYKNA